LQVLRRDHERINKTTTIISHLRVDVNNLLAVIRYVVEVLGAPSEVILKLNSLWQECVEIREMNEPVVLV